MDCVETLIPDGEGNHLVVVLTFYEDIEKTDTFRIPQEFSGLDIADISINKLDLDKPLHLRAFFRMCTWLVEQIQMYPNAVFSFICSTDELSTNHKDMAPEQYRWNLFEFFYTRCKTMLGKMGIESKEIIVGPEDYQTFARVFYRISHAPIIHLVVNHLTHKYSE